MLYCYCHVYFEPVRPQVIYQTFSYLKSRKKFYENISIPKGLSSEDMFRLSDIAEIQGQNKNVTEKNFSDRKEVSENRNGTET